MKPIYFIFLVLAVTSLACGTTVGAIQPTIITAPAQVLVSGSISTARPTLTAFVPTILQVRVTATTLNVRKSPSTDSEVLKVYETGKVLTVGAMVENTCQDCSKWYPIDPRGWVCADFVEVVK